MNKNNVTRKRQVKQLLDKIEMHLHCGTDVPDGKLERTQYLLDILTKVNEKNINENKNQVHGKQIMNLVNRYEICKHISDKANKLQLLEQDIQDITELFNDLNELIIAAEPVVETIVTAVESSKEKMEEGVQELEKADAYPRINLGVKIGLVGLGVALGPTAIMLGYGAKVITMGSVGILVGLYAAG